MVTDYLSWARDTSDAVDTCANCYNLASSSIEEPTDLLLKHSQRLHVDGLRQTLNEPDGWGQPSVIAALGARYNIPAPGERILLTTGASGAYIIVAHALVNAGEHVIIEAPTYQPFVKVMQSVGADITRVPRRSDDDALDLEAIEAAVTAKTALIVISNLHNPSATYTDEATLRDLAVIARRHGLHVLVDEIYHDFVVGSRPAALVDDVFITISSLTKVYGLALLRCGWMIAAPDVIQRIRPTHAIYGNGTSRFTHAMVARLLTDFAAYRDHWQTIVRQNRASAESILTPLIDDGMLIGNIPAQGCVYFPRVAGLDDVGALVQWLADERRIRVVPGHFFGAPAHIRIGLGRKPDETRAGLQQLAEALRLYRAKM